MDILRNLVELCDQAPESAQPCLKACSGGEAVPTGERLIGLGIGISLRTGSQQGVGECTFMIIPTYNLFYNSPKKPAPSSILTTSM